MNDWISGTGVALITPFTSEGAVDIPALQRVVRHMIEGNVDYLVVLGTTGETATLSQEEKQAVIGTVIEANQDRLPIVLGVGGNNTQEVAKQMRAQQKQWDIQAFLSVSPYYNKPTQEGIYQHFAALAEASELPIILYNVPGRTASNMEAKTTLRLANDFENIVAIKEASGNLSQCMEILQEKPAGFHLVSGDDYLTVPLVALGASGVISVAANAFPLPFTSMVRQALDGDFAGARESHFTLLPLMNLNFAEGNPVGVKTLLEFQGICSNAVRLPLVAASASLKTEMKAAWDRSFRMHAE